MSTNKMLLVSRGKQAIFYWDKHRKLGLYGEAICTRPVGWEGIRHVETRVCGGRGGTPDRGRVVNKRGGR